MNSLIKAKKLEQSVVEDPICYDGFCTDLVQYIWNIFHDHKLMNPVAGSLVSNTEAVSLRKEKLGAFFDKV